MTAFCRRKVCALPEEAKAETVHPGFSHKFNTMDWLENEHNKDAERFLDQIKIGYWVNMRSCYGDVWQKVLSVHECKENPIRSFLTIARKTEKRGVNVIIPEMETFYSIRHVSETLPNEARIIIDEKEYTNIFYPDRSFKIQ